MRFTSLDEARSYLFAEVIQLYNFSRRTADQYRYRQPDTIGLEIIAESHKLDERLQKWLQSFDSFIERSSLTMSRKELECATLLRIHYKVTKIHLFNCLYTEETVYDRSDDTFQDIVVLSESLLTTGSLSKSPSFIFSLDLGIVQPLYYAATKCRYPPTRERAILLLHSFPRQEGVWDSVVVAKLAERVKSIEEETLSKSMSTNERVPEFRRIHSVDTSIDRDRRRTEVTYTQRLNGMDGEWDERIEWIYW